MEILEFGWLQQLFSRHRWELHVGSSSGTYVAPFTGKLLIRAWGGGATGGSSGADAGGGSGGFSEKQVNVTAGDTLSWTAGGAGSNTTITSVPLAVNITANSGSGASGGSSSGGDTNITGASGNPLDGDNGGDGGTAPSGVVPGPAIIGGTGGAGGGKKEDGSAGFSPGGGGGGAGKQANIGGTGGAGMVVFIIWK